MIDFILLGAVIIGIVQAIKILIGPNSRWIPTIAIVVGMVLVVSASLLNDTPITWENIINGLIASLTAVGLWGGTKSTFGK